MTDRLHVLLGLMLSLGMLAGVLGCVGSRLERHAEDLGKQAPAQKCPCCKCENCKCADCGCK